VAVGAFALDANSTASDNTAVGYNSLTANTTGTRNAALGTYTLTANSTGNYNTAVGWAALDLNTTASNNTAVGYNSLAANTTGTDNVAVGYETLDGNTTGGYNTAIGVQALGDQTTGADNTAVGFQSLKYNTTGNRNTSLGWQSLLQNTTGTYNVGLGMAAGDSTVTTGSYNILIGAVTELGSAGQENQIVIGYSATGKGSSTGFISPNGGGVYQGNNSSTWSTTSDKRIKKNIVDNDTGLDAINQIQVRNFEYRTEEEITDFENPAAVVVKKEGLQLGVIAQEIEEILPDVVTDLESGCKSVNPDNLTWYLVNAVKELSAKCDSLQSEINILKGN
jgi:hypothetical protein